MSVLPTKRRRVHPVDEVLPVPKLAAYGFQHVVAFYAGAVLVPIIIGSAIGLTNEQLIHLINADLFTCGIASIIQSVGFWKVGVRLPLLQGVTFAGVSPVIAIAMANGGGTEGLLYVYGAVIVAGLFTFFMAPYFSKLLRFFPPVVTGTVITIIGVALLPVAVNDAVTNPATHEQDPTNGRWMAYAIGTLLIIVLIQRFFKGFMATIAVLLWMATLYILSGQLIAMSQIFEYVLGADRWVGALLGGVVVTVYFTAGGLWSSAWVNMVQLGVLLVGMLIAVPLALSAAGGWEAVQAAARAMGQLLRACRVRRGLGTIRQDLNVSIPQGVRVELKGFQDLGTMPQVVEREMERQAILAAVEACEPGPATEITALLKKSREAWGCRLPGWASLLGSPESPAGHPRLGRELANHARRVGVAGLLQSDELPAHGVSAEEAAAIATELNCGEADAFILVFEKKTLAKAALARACNRARQGGVPHEVRRVLAEGGSRYLRPMPGAARMYPETDIPPLRLARNAVELPPTLVERIAVLPLGAQQAGQLVRARLDARFHALVAAGGPPKAVARLLLHQLPELRKAGLPAPSEAVLGELLAAVADGKLAKEGVEDALAALARGEALPEQAASGAGELDAFIEQLLAERKDFVQQRGMEAVGPLMGAVMGEFRGRVDGALVSERLRVKLGEFLG